LASVKVRAADTAIMHLQHNLTGAGDRLWRI
jgi:hypothetical protein